MRTRTYAILAAALAGGVALSPAVFAASGETVYSINNLSSLGGTVSVGNSIDDIGLISGFSNLAGDTTSHATVWIFGSKFDLGTLGGANSNVVWPVKNNRGLISGIAETASLDPLHENWSCQAFFPTATGHSCLGFVLEFGRMRALPTLGGNNGFATGTNNLGQTVGWAENTVHDPTCNAPQVLQFRAVIWGPGKNRIQELPPLAGDTVSAATAINDRGQVVGISGICSNAVGGRSAIHNVLWENGKATDLGNIGGDSWNTPMAINQRGDVVGFANPIAGTAFRAHAFIWTRADGIQDLGTLPGDSLSEALGINNKGQVVGLSCTAGFASCRAFLWQDGVMSDLNTMLAPGYFGHLFQASDINDLGRITGQAVDANTGNSVTYIGTPVRGRRNHSVSATSATLPEEVRATLLKRTGPGAGL